MWIASTSEWLPSGCLPLGHPQAWTGPEPGRRRAGAALPSPTPVADRLLAQMVGVALPRDGKWPIGRGGFARDAIPPVPPKTARSGPQPPNSAIESHLRIAEYFRIHGPVSTSEFAAVSTPPPRNNSLRYKENALLFLLVLSANQPSPFDAHPLRLHRAPDSAAAHSRRDHPGSQGRRGRCSPG